jgi:hypothetical protein
MLYKTSHVVEQSLLDTAISSLPLLDGRLALNQPTGSFFNDPWEIKPEFKDTCWYDILESLPYPKGEARIIKLAQGESYARHADIDDRWHLSLTGNHSYLINLDTDTMYPIERDGYWYSMNAGVRHTAANFGSCDRVQLVVRKLLPISKITNPVNVSIKLISVVEDRRFIFDDIISPWLNSAYKKGIVDNFKGVDLEATFTVEESYVPELTELIKDYFTIETSL